MYIDKNRITLTEDTYTYISRVSEQEIFETFRDTLKKYINIINYFVNQDLKKLTDEEFYDLICKVYSISLTEQDYLKIISKRNDKKYNRFATIGTFMTFTSTATEGQGKDFSWWKQLYQIRYIVAVAEDSNLNGCDLKKEDIKKLIQDKSIVIIGSEEKPINNKLRLNEEVEEMPSIKLNYSYSFGDMRGYINKDDNFSVIVSMLREKITKKKIFEDMRNYIEELQEDIDFVLSNSHMAYDYSEVSKLSNEWYETSKEKAKLKSLQKKLTDNQI